LLGDLLAQRCHCDVRIDDDPDYNDLQAINDNSDSNNNGNVYDDNIRRAPSALVVIHLTTPCAESRGAEIWLSGLRWKTSRVDLTAATWIGLERHSMDECDKSLAIYHVFFLSPHATTELREHG
jgi:hypothetical protein